MSFGQIALLAQDDTDPREKFTVGVKAGVNVSNVWDERGQDFKAKSKLGFAGGAFVSIPIGKYLGVQPEVLFSQKGLKATGTLFSAPYSYKKTSSYLDIPLQIQVKPVEFVTILAGPQFSFLMHEKVVYTFNDSTSLAQETEFKNDNVRKNILGFVTGLDINISHVVISGRMGWDFQTNHGDGTYSTPRYKNRWVQLTVGVKI